MTKHLVIYKRQNFKTLDDPTFNKGFAITTQELRRLPSDCIVIPLNDKEAINHFFGSYTNPQIDFDFYNLNTLTEIVNRGEVQGDDRDYSYIFETVYITEWLKKTQITVIDTKYMCTLGDVKDAINDLDRMEDNFLFSKDTDIEAQNKYYEIKNCRTMLEELYEIFDVLDTVKDLEQDIYATNM